tara:strand:+ start:656 stop:949 length:294 start_codon:yes stop_codon:yes gene_type:complete
MGKAKDEWGWSLGSIVLVFGVIILLAAIAFSKDEREIGSLPINAIPSTPLTADEMATEIKKCEELGLGYKMFSKPFSRTGPAIVYIQCYPKKVEQDD